VRTNAAAGRASLTWVHRETQRAPDRCQQSGHPSRVARHPRHGQAAKASTTSSVQRVGGYPRNATGHPSHGSDGTLVDARAPCAPPGPTTRSLDLFLGAPCSPEPDELNGGDNDHQNVDRICKPGRCHDSDDGNSAGTGMVPGSAQRYDGES
jgi:hypothetical protein